MVAALKSLRGLNSQSALLLPLIIVYGALAALPIATIVRMSFERGFASYEKLFASRIFSTVLWNTFYVSAITTVVAVILGYLIALLLWRSGPVARVIIVTLVLLPFWTSVMIKIFTWTVLLHDGGVINRFLQWTTLTDQPLPLFRNKFSIVFGLVHYVLPYAIFPIFATMISIDTRIERAARSLGASTASTFFLVTLPLTASGVYAAGLLVFIVSIGGYVIPLVLGSPREMMVANLVYYFSQQMIDFNTAAALSVVILVAATVLVGIYQYMPKDGQFGKS